MNSQRDAQDSPYEQPLSEVPSHNDQNSLDINRLLNPPKRNSRAVTPQDQMLRVNQQLQSQDISENDNVHSEQMPSGEAVIQKNNNNQKASNNKDNKLKEEQPILDDMGELMDIKRSVVIDKKLYTYIGKPHPEIIQLLELLEQNSQKPSKFDIINKWRTQISKVENYFKQKCTFFEGKATLTFYECVMYICFLALYITSAIQYGSLSNESTVQKSEWKQLVATIQIWFGAIFTVYGIVYIHIKSILVIFLLFIGLVVVQVILLLYDFNLIFSWNTKDFSMSTFLSRIYPMILFVHWFIFSNLYNWIKKVFSESSAMFFGIVWYLILPYFLAVQVLTYLFESQEYSTYYVINRILQIIIGPIIILILISWVLLHNHLFMLPLSHIQTAIARIKEEIQKKFRKAIPVKDQSEEEIGSLSRQERWQKWARQNFYLLTSAVVGLIYVGCEIYLIFTVYYELERTTVILENVIVLVFQMIAIPIFIILGIIIAVSDRKQWLTFTFFPLFVGALPLFGIIPIASLVVSSDISENWKYTIIVSAPFIVVFWLCLGLFGIQRRFYFLFSITYMFFFFAFPISFLLPLSFISVDGVNTSVVKIIAYSIMGLGICIALVYLVYYLVKNLFQVFTQKNKKELIDITALSYLNLRNAGFLINSSGFVFGYTLLCYVFYARPSTSSNDEKGFVDGMLIVLPVLFLLIVNSIQTDSAEITSGDGDYDQEDENSAASRQQALQTNMEYIQKSEKLKFQKRLIIIGVLVPFISLLPLFFVFSDRQTSARFLIVMVGIPISFIIYAALLEVKNKSEKFQNLFTPFLVAVCWCCCIFPILIIAPILASYIDSSGQDFATFMKGLIVVMAFLVVSGVTCFSIFIFIIKNQLEKEKRKKFVILQLLKACMDYRVKVMVNPLAIFYDHFAKLQEDEDKMKHLLQHNRKPIRYDNVKPKVKNFDQRIIVAKTQAQKAAEKAIALKRSNWDICMDYLLCRIGMLTDELDEHGNDNEKTEIQLDDLTDDIENVEQCMDDYLPKQIQKGYLYQQEEEQLGLMEQIEKTDEKRVFEVFEKSKLKGKTKFDVESSKTAKFKDIKIKKTSNVTFSKNKFTDYGQLIYNSEEERASFCHDIYDDFSNEDDNLPKTLIYTDFEQFCRLSGIIESKQQEPLSVKDITKQSKKLQDSFEDDLGSDNDEDEIKYLTPQQVSQIYDAHAAQLWKGGLLSLNLQNFASALLSIAGKLATNKESITPTLRLRELLYERVVGNLFQNVPYFANNYRPDVRKFMKKDNLESRLKESPFLLTIPLADIGNTQQLDRQMFDYSNKNRVRVVDKDSFANGATPQLNYSVKTPSRFHKTDSSVQPIDSNNNTNPSVSKPKQSVPCFIMMCRCLRKCCCLYPAMLGTYICSKIDRIISRLSKPKIINKFNREPVVVRAPNWDEMAQNLVTTMVMAIKTYEQNKKQAEQITLSFSLNNLIIAVGKLGDFITLYGVAFKNSVEWFPGLTTSVNAQTVTSGSYISNFQFVFWISVVLGIVYFFIAIVAVRYAERGTLGKDQNGETATPKHGQFYLSKVVNLLGSSLFLFIMKSFIDSYICDWSGTSPWYLYRSSSTECLGNLHLYMMGAGFISLLAYYPLATFIQPGIQFLDATLDLKYDKAYVAVYIQAKLIVLGTTSFFDSFNSQTMISIVQLSTTSAIGFLMAILVIKMKPCLVWIINPLEVGGFLLIGIINGTGLMIVLSGQSLIGFIVSIGLQLLVIGAVGIIIHRRLKNRKKEKKSFQSANLPIIIKTENRRKDQNNILGERVYVQEEDNNDNNNNKELQVLNMDVLDDDRSVQQRQVAKKKKQNDFYSDDSGSKKTDQVFD